MLRRVLLELLFTQLPLSTFPAIGRHRYKGFVYLIEYIIGFRVPCGTCTIPVRGHSEGKPSTSGEMPVSLKAVSNGRRHR